MNEIKESIDVNVPVTTAYNQWTQFEEFPRFMDGVNEVKQLSDARLHWIASVAGVQREWDAKITQQEPDRVIAWESITGSRNAGVVTFESLDPARTRVSLAIEFEPEGLVEKTGDVLGMWQRRAEADLERFKAFVEERGRESGEWRGEIEDGRVIDLNDERTQPFTVEPVIDRST